MSTANCDNDSPVASRPLCCTVINKLSINPYLMYTATLSWFLQTSTGLHNTVQNRSYKNIFRNCYKTVSWKLFEDYGDNFTWFLLVLLLCDFFLKECLFSAENLSQKGFNHTRENTMKLYLQTVTFGTFCEMYEIYVKSHFPPKVPQLLGA